MLPWKPCYPCKACSPCLHQTKCAHFSFMHQLANPQNIWSYETPYRIFKGKRKGENRETLSIFHNLLGLFWRVSDNFSAGYRRHTCKNENQLLHMCRGLQFSNTLSHSRHNYLTRDIWGCRWMQWCLLNHWDKLFRTKNVETTYYSLYLFLQRVTA